MNDEQHYQHLLEQLQSRQLALFIGADLPRDVTGLPSRADLARELARRYHLNESFSLAEVAQRVSQAGSRFEFTDFIRNALDTTGKRPPEFHQMIVALVKEHGISAIITTAYDNLLEAAFQLAGVGLNRVVRGSDIGFLRPDRPTLIKLYGDAQQPDTLVVTDRDHSQLLRDRNKEDVVEEVRRAFKRNTLLFYGYDLSDPDFKFLFDQIAESKLARLAYAVWPPKVSEADVRMWRDRGLVILEENPFKAASEPAIPITDAQPKAIESVPADSSIKVRKDLSQDRVLDAAIAERVPVGKSTDLVALVRQTSSDGLRAILKIDTVYKISPSVATSRPFGVEFPMDAAGVLKPAQLTLKIDSPDFEPKSQSKTILVPPEGDSGLCTFFLVAQHAGELMLNLDVLTEGCLVTSRLLRTNGEASEREVITTSKTLVSIPLTVTGYGTVTALPVVSASPGIALPPQERALVQHVHQGSSQVLVEKEFGGGYSGTRVLLTLPSAADGTPAAGKVTKLGPALDLRSERDNYQLVKDFLPFCVAPVTGYYEQDDWAALNYEWVGGGALGRAVSLEDYYRARPVEQIVKTLGDLLDRELSQRWYRNARPVRSLCAAEYGIHMLEHLRIELRPASADGLWPLDHPLAQVAGYRTLDLETIRQEREAIGPNTLAVIEELIVARIRPGQIKLLDSNGEGIVVRVEFLSDNNAAQKLQVGDRVGVRGRVVYNRRGRLEEIVRRAFSDRPPGSGESIQLPQVTGTFPNPVTMYPDVLGKTLELGRSYVHGDLHLRNVLVDDSGKGWLIDLAKVGKGHRLYDFIKLETYIRLMALAREDVTFSLDEYAQFEAALNDATLARGGEQPPANEHLKKAYHVIRAIRELARKVMGPEPDFEKEYFPALFLYCLAVMKYADEARSQPTRLAFTTAAVLARYLSGAHGTASPSTRESKGEGQAALPQSILGAGQRWAVLVGVNEYADQANYGRLQVCVKDTQALRDRLIASGYEANRLRLLIDGGAEQPTRNHILAALQAVANAADENDLLLFYYSGHGDEANGESYLVAHDGQRVVLSDTGVSITRVKQIMEQARARAKVIILDACHSGVDFHGKGPQRMSAGFIRRVFEEAQGLAILASCQQGEVSYEWRAQERSVFTHYLLEALAGQADRDEKGFVTVQDANRHVADGVKLWASQRNLSQTPTLHYSVAGDIILAGDLHKRS